MPLLILAGCFGKLAWWECNALGATARHLGDALVQQNPHNWTSHVLITLWLKFECFRIFTTGYLTTLAAHCPKRPIVIRASGNGGFSAAAEILHRLNIWSYRLQVRHLVVLHSGLRVLSPLLVYQSQSAACIPVYAHNLRDLRDAQGRVDVQLAARLSFSVSISVTCHTQLTQYGESGHGARCTISKILQLDRQMRPFTRVHMHVFTFYPRHVSFAARQSLRKGRLSILNRPNKQ